MSPDLPDPLRVLFLASEADPFFKVGGLGDYAGSLPGALKTVSRQQGQTLDIRVGLPLHHDIHTDNSELLKLPSLRVAKRVGFSKGSAFLLKHAEIPHYFIRRASASLKGTTVYSTSPIQDAQKFVFFSLASLELAHRLAWQPHIIHANDWHTAVAVYQCARLRHNQPFFKAARTLLVIHNLPFMGAGSEDVLTEFGIPPVDETILPEWSRHFPLVLGLAAADRIAAVSPSYARELRQSKYSNGLKDFFIQRAPRTSGILNGIDTQVWNPAGDAHLARPFSAEQIESRAENKRAILHQVAFSQAESHPLLVLISRLDIQKGIDLLLSLIPRILDQSWNLIVLGTGNAQYEQAFSQLQSEHPQRLRFFGEFNTSLAHQLYAAGDILLMPSRYEPCGLSQMIAMRYGCLPVACAVGGLRDTIRAESDAHRTGYLFKPAALTAFEAAVRQALQDYRDPLRWRQFQLNAMRRDYSWRKSALQYLRLYREIMEPTQQESG